MITSFNASTTERCEMFERKQPEMVWMPVVLLHQAGSHQSRPADLAERLANRINKLDRTTDSNSRLIIPMVHRFEMPDYLVSLLQPKQLTWMIDDVYLQCGYYDEVGVRGIVSSIAHAMTVYDTSVEMSGKIDPSAHASIQASDEDSTAFERAVGNHFRSGVGVWSKHLVEHRCKVLVSSRAILMGRDPVQEWERFKGAAVMNHLDHPALCP